jgi:beta-1,4-mannosyl-glycoprotein beta-1,4-N-acetylglucosaminyltransferase
VIYDCFTFFDEVDLLELRLRTLEGVVDRFVIVEADVTFQGGKKPLNYSDNAARFARWSDKIIYVPVTDMPDTETAWDREHYQRRAIIRGLDGAADNDLIVIADVDEIPRPEALIRLANEAAGPVALRMDMYYYFANVLITRTWDLPRAARRSDLSDAQALRSAKGLPVVEGAGWHFSYFMDRDSIRHKLASFSHVEYANDRFMSPLHIDRSMKLGIRLFGGGLNEIVSAADLPPVLTADPHYAKYFHPGLTRFDSLLARGYELTTTCRNMLPNRLTDDHPVLAFFAAVPIVGFRKVRRRVSGVRRRAKARLAQARGLAMRAVAGQ